MSRCALILAVLMTLHLGCSTMPEVSDEPSLQPGPITVHPLTTQVIAHRGASAYAPENTLAAFALAGEMGADWFELDCHLTADGQVVVIHDGNTERTGDSVVRIADHTLAEVEAVDVGKSFGADFAGERIPTLTQALNQARDKIGVYIELKSAIDDRPLFEKLVALAEGHEVMDAELQHQMMEIVEADGAPNLALARKVVEVVRELEMEHQVVFQSFSPAICLALIAEEPDLRVEFLGYDDEDAPSYWPAYVWFGMFIDADGFNIREKDATPERIEYFQSYGKSVAVWTVDDEARIRELGSLGVNAIISNKPDLCLKVLEEMGRRQTPPTGQPTAPVPDAEAA